MAYEWQGSNALRRHRDEPTIEVGEVFEPTAGELRAFGDSIREVEREESPTCAGNDGECSREVDEEGGRCWQHPDE